MRSIACLLLVITNSCATSPIKHALIDQILKPRTGFEGHLTNSRCVEFNTFGKCSKLKVITYDINDKSVRKLLRDLKFVCKIADQRYKISAEKAAFFRVTYTKKCWLCAKKKKIDYIEITEYERLKGANTRCFSEERYSWVDI